MPLADDIAAVNRALDARNTQRARELIAPLLTAHPESPDVVWTAGRFLGLLGAHAQAAAQFKLAVQRDPALSHIEFAIGSKVVRLRDVAGSTWASEVLDEFARGMYSLAELKFAKGDVIVDVGAHIGGVSIILATLHPQTRIIAFEPAASNYASFCDNLNANRITNVTAVKRAVMGEPGELTLTWAPHATAGSVVGLPDSARLARERDGWKSETVACVTLDDIFAEHKIDRCSWLKLDCESAEWEILAKSSVLNRVDRMAVELHIPASRQKDGVDALTREFVALLDRVSPKPLTTIASTLWVVDM